MRIFWKKSEKKARSLEDIANSANVEVENEVGESAEVDEPAVEVDNVDKCESEDTPDVKFNPLGCFGYEEEKTEKWLIKCVKVWHYGMLLLWFVFGALTFAPILFISDKVNVIFKNKIKSLIVATVIYVAFVAFLVVLFATRNGDKAKEVVERVDTL